MVVSHAGGHLTKKSGAIILATSNSSTAHLRGASGPSPIADRVDLLQEMDFNRGLKGE
jgi:hypothetical protein